MSNNEYIKRDEVGKKIQDLKSFLLLAKFARPFKWGFVFSFALLLLGGGFLISGARLMGVLVQEGLMKHDWSKTYVCVSAILLLEILHIISIWWGRRQLALASSECILSIRKTIFGHVHHLPISYYDRQPEGRTVTRMTHDVEGIEEFFTGALGRLLSSIITFFMAMGAMLLTDWRLGVLLVLSMSPAMVMMMLTRNRIRYLNREVSICNSSCNAKLSEYLKGVAVIRSFGLEEWSRENYDQVVDRHREIQMSANNYYAWTRPITNFLCSVPLMALLGFGGQRVLAGQLSIGIFVAFIRYCERFSNPLAALSREIHVIQQAFTSVERVMTFLNAEKEDDVLGDDGQFYSKESLRGHLIFQNVSMSYDEGKVVLDKIGLEIAPGEKIGVAGTTGSGKTTAISLLARLYEYQQGEILLDGRSIRDYKRNFLRENLGFVSQDVVIFHGSLKENLTCEVEYPEEDIRWAVERTGLQAVMDNNRWGLNMEILDGGSNLSAGEKQLISLTRVLLKNPTILILDEATASIDPYHERLIHQAIDLVMVGRTCLMVAHRLDTLKKCDRILVFKEGRLVEEGTHGELMRIKGHFYGLQQQNQQGVEDEENAPSSWVGASGPRIPQ